MKIDILTIFPEMFDSLKVSLLGKATEKNLLQISTHDIREYSADKHHKTDDYTFGGGAGMIMTPQPIHDCIDAVDPAHKALRIYMSPKGKKLDQNLVKQLAEKDYILLLCGHYEGVDQRVIDFDIDMELSIGDYVLTGGEIPAMAVVDAVARYVPSVLGSENATDEESFSDGMLEYPQYTRPQVYLGMEVPSVLVSGDHKKIAEWRKEQSELLTKKNRPDLVKK
ncbi:MAG TPA: tRNA (guanosine(37)-N1)-methyltransferase TrmD [Eubacteriales bacterium]|nr:tRNA (guanosine(37)-N1)-methyltransferase TrmD [Eubacteriales bacterium]